MDTYALIQGEKSPKRWVFVLKEKDFDAIEKMADRWHTAVIRDFMLKGSTYLSVQKIDEYLWGYINNVVQYLNEGKTVLFNNKGGISFLTEDTEILKVVKSEDTLEEYHLQNTGLSGWLSPRGEFYPCPYGEHKYFSQEYEGNDGDDFIKIGCYPGLDSQSYIHFPKQVSEEQVQWLKNHEEDMDRVQKKEWHSQQRG